MDSNPSKPDPSKDAERKDSTKDVKSKPSESKDTERKDSTKDAEKKDSAKDAEKKDPTKDAEKKDSTMDAEKKDSTKDVEKKDSTKDAEKKDSAMDAEKKDSTKDAERKDLTKDAQKNDSTKDAEKKDSTMDAEKQNAAKDAGLKDLDKRKDSTLVPDKKVLFVGLACLDIIMVCKEYPKEDSDQRAMSYRWQRGGNASNSCYVLQSFEIGPTEFLGTLSEDYGGRFLLKNMQEQGIYTQHCVILPGCTAPAACVFLSAKTGTRTIVHYNKDLPELVPSDLIKLHLERYKWIHFEGRNVVSILEMIDYITEHNERAVSKIKVSVEVEKKKEDLKILLKKADVVFVGKEFASLYGCLSDQDAVRKLAKFVKPGAILIAAWAEKGASVKDSDGSFYHSDAFSPDMVVDTLGAGDTFVAACIGAFTLGMRAADVIKVGCRVAGAKCGTEGFDSKMLANVFSCATVRS